jgi:hypothetical protein
MAKKEGNTNNGFGQTFWKDLNKNNKTTRAPDSLRDRYKRFLKFLNR